MNNLTWRELYFYGQKELKKIANISADSELLHIFWHCFKMEKSDIILNSSEPVLKEDVDKFLEILEKRKSGMPLQYSIGKWEFMNIELNVGEGVLIPREDTSVLVNALLENLAKKRPQAKNLEIIDLCSGSGCIALALEKNIKPPAEIYAVEISAKAFDYLKMNHLKNSSKIKIINDDIFNCFYDFEDDTFDAVVSNPPYIRSSDIKNLQPEVRREPALALDGGIDGLDFYRKICKYWIQKLRPGGVLAFEVGFGQADDVKNIMQQSGLKTMAILDDINSVPRAVLAVKPLH